MKIKIISQPGFENEIGSLPANLARSTQNRQRGLAFPPRLPGSGLRAANVAVALLCLMLAGLAGAAANKEIDPLVKASAYGDKTVWSYHDSKPVPWALFRPRDYGSTPVTFESKGVRPVGKVPAPGVHPRIFFSPEDLPALRQRVKTDAASQAAWKNLLAWCNALKNTYDEKADYAKPDWSNGSFGVHGRFEDLMRIGGYGPKRENYYAKLAAGEKPARYQKDSPAEFFKPAACEALRCLIDDDAEGAKTLAKAVVTAVQLEQQRRAREDKPVAAGQPPRPSTSRSSACGLGYVYDFIFNYLTAEQKKILHDELVLLSAWADNYGTFNNAEASRSNWATFSYWVFDLMAIEGEPGFNDLKFLGLYRGWRNFYTYSFFDSGAAFEGEGKLLFGLDAAVAFDRVGWKYGLEPLTQHPLPRSYYGKFSAYAMLPTRDKFAVFDILGGMGGGFTTPHDLVIAKYLFPQDQTTDFVYRALVGDDYRSLPHSLHFHWHQAIMSAVFATAYDPATTPDKLNLPLTFFCGQRAVMMTRSSWDTNATMLTMHVRGASGGHPYRDRNGLLLAAQGRTWVTIPSKDIGGWAMNTVIIDGAEQNASTPGRVVDFADEPKATFMTGDAKHSWDWVWHSVAKNKQDQTCTLNDVFSDNVQTGPTWKLVEQCFNDFAWTKSENRVYKYHQKFNHSWLAMDGAITPVIRQPNQPVLKSFRTAGLVRGTHPYVLVVDDVQRDPMPTRYDWNLSLPADVVELKRPTSLGAEGDIILAGTNSLTSRGVLKSGEPALLIRVLQCEGKRLPDEIGLHEKWNLLSLRTVAASPDFKVLLHAFRMGDPLPETQWNSARTEVAVEFPDQHDMLRFAAAESGKTDVVVDRGGRTLVRAAKAVEPLNDPESDALTLRLKRIAKRVPALRLDAYDPAKEPGFVAGWRFDQLTNSAYPPVAGSAAGAKPVPAPDGRQVDGPGGRAAAFTGKKGLSGLLDFAAKTNAVFTVSVWVKTKSDPWMGNIVSVDGIGGFSLIQSGLRFDVAGMGSVDSLASSMLSSWTHLVVTCDRTTLCLYRNSIPLMSAPVGDKKIRWGKQFRLGGEGGYGDAEVSVANLYFFSTALSPAAVEDLYMAEKYLGDPLPGSDQ